MAMQQDKDLDPEGKKTVADILRVVRTTQGDQLTLDKVKELSPYVAHCQVVRTKKKGFINILLRGEGGTLVMKHLEPALNRDGKRQWDPTVPKPIHRDIKNAILDSKRRGR